MIYILGGYSLVSLFCWRQFYGWLAYDGIATKGVVDEFYDKRTPDKEMGFWVGLMAALIWPIIVAVLFSIAIYDALPHNTIVTRIIQPSTERKAKRLMLEHSNEEKAKAVLEIKE